MSAASSSGSSARRILKVYPLTPEIRAAMLTRANHASDSGLDLYTDKRMVIEPGSCSVKVHLGVICAPGNFTGGYLLVPRSSTGSKTPLRLSNSIGIIDQDYRGELMACVDHVGLAPSFAINPMDRLFQIVMPDLQPFDIQVVDSLAALGDPTARGEGGFGSTSLAAQ